MANEGATVVERVLAVIEERRDRPPEKRSYVVALMEGGVEKIGGKIREEAGEVVEAAGELGPEGRAHFVHEVADLLFHTLVMMGHKGVGWGEIERELGRRFGVSGIEEKESRGKQGGGVSASGGEG